MAINEYYVDGSLGSDTGNGSVGTPWGRADGDVIQYALDTITPATSGNHDRIHIKANGASDAVNMVATLDFTSYGSPSTDSVLVFRGYTTAAKDGGRAIIDLNGFQFISEASKSYIHLHDLEIYDSTFTAISRIWEWSSGGSMINCILRDADPGKVFDCNAVNLILGNWIYNTRGYCEIGTQSLVKGNKFITGPSNNFESMLLNASGAANCITDNIFSAPTGLVDGIRAQNGNWIFNNVLYAATGNTGQAIDESGTDRYFGMVANNQLEGWDGVGSVGVDNSGNSFIMYMDGNTYFNMTDDYNIPAGMPLYGDASEEVLLASGFVDAANGDFSPSAVGKVAQGSRPGFIGNF